MYSMIKSVASSIATPTVPITPTLPSTDTSSVSKTAATIVNFIDNIKSDTIIQTVATQK